MQQAPGSGHDPRPGQRGDLSVREPHRKNRKRQNPADAGGKPLSQIAIEVLASLNSLNKDKERLIEIVADGKIDNDELHDFANIQIQLEQLSTTVAALQLWINQTIAEGKIDKEKLDAIHAEMEAQK